MRCGLCGRRFVSPGEYAEHNCKAVGEPGNPPFDDDGRMELPGTVEGYEAGEREYARDLFAAGAIQAMVTAVVGVRHSPGELAKSAYDIADAMMAERDKRRNADG